MDIKNEKTGKSPIKFKTTFVEKKRANTTVLHTLSLWIILVLSANDWTQNIRATLYTKLSAQFLKPHLFFLFYRL